MTANLKFAIFLIMLVITKVQSDFQVSTVSERKLIGGNSRSMLNENEKCIKILKTKLSEFLQKLERPNNKDGTPSQGRVIEEILNKNIFSVKEKCSGTTFGVAQYVVTEAGKNEMSFTFDQLVIQKISMKKRGFKTSISKPFPTNFNTSGNKIVNRLNEEREILEDYVKHYENYKGVEIQLESDRKTLRDETVEQIKKLSTWNEGDFEIRLAMERRILENEIEKSRLLYLELENMKKENLKIESYQQQENSKFDSLSIQCNEEKKRLEKFIANCQIQRESVVNELEIERQRFQQASNMVNEKVTNCELVMKQERDKIESMANQFNEGKLKMDEIIATCLDQRNSAVNELEVERQRFNQANSTANEKLTVCEFVKKQERDKIEVMTNQFSEEKRKLEESNIICEMQRKNATDELEVQKRHAKEAKDSAADEAMECEREKQKLRNDDETLMEKCAANLTICSLDLSNINSHSESYKKECEQDKQQLKNDTEKLIYKYNNDKILLEEDGKTCRENLDKSTEVFEKAIKDLQEAHTNITEIATKREKENQQERDKYAKLQIQLYEERKTSESSTNFWLLQVKNVTEILDSERQRFQNATAVAADQMSKCEKEKQDEKSKMDSITNNWNICQDEMKNISSLLEAEKKHAQQVHDTISDVVTKCETEKETLVNYVETLKDEVINEQQKCVSYNKICEADKNNLNKSLVEMEKTYAQQVNATKLCEEAREMGKIETETKSKELREENMKLKVEKVGCEDNVRNITIFLNKERDMRAEKEAFFNQLSANFTVHVSNLEGQIKACKTKCEMEFGGDRCANCCVSLSTNRPSPNAPDKIQPILSP